jgi:hypothetical protein
MVGGVSGSARQIQLASPDPHSNRGFVFFMRSMLPDSSWAGDGALWMVVRAGERQLNSDLAFIRTAH